MELETLAMELETLAQQCPSVFADRPSSDRSKRYAPISTQYVLDTLLLKGYELRSAMQRRTKKEEWQGYQKHVLNFAIPNTRTDTHELSLLVGNSFNGDCAFFLALGANVFLCNNGLVSYSSEFESKIKHTQKYVYNYQTEVDRMIDKVPTLIATIDRMKQVKLGFIKRVLFAHYANKLRYGKSYKLKNTMRFLDCQHKGQEDNTVWNVLNRVQETTIKGRKKLKMRELKSIDSHLTINQKLWVYAERLLQ